MIGLSRIGLEVSIKATLDQRLVFAGTHDENHSHALRMAG